MLGKMGGWDLAVQAGVSPSMDMRPTVSQDCMGGERGTRLSSQGWAWTRFWVGDVFLAPPSSGSHRSPDMGDLMATFTGITASDPGVGLQLAVMVR